MFVAHISLQWDWPLLAMLASYIVVLLCVYSINEPGKAMEHDPNALECAHIADVNKITCSWLCPRQNLFILASWEVSQEKDASCVCVSVFVFHFSAFQIIKYLKRKG